MNKLLLTIALIFNTQVFADKEANIPSININELCKERPNYSALTGTYRLKQDQLNDENIEFRFLQFAVTYDQTGGERAALSKVSFKNKSITDKQIKSISDELGRSIEFVEDLYNEVVGMFFSNLCEGGTAKPEYSNDSKTGDINSYRIEGNKLIIKFQKFNNELSFERLRKSEVYYSSW